MKTIATFSTAVILFLSAVANDATAQNRTTHYFQTNETGSDAGSRSFELLAFPNPAENYMTVQLPYVARNTVAMLILDYNGTVLRTYRFAPGGQSYSADVSFLERGNYLVHVHEGGQIAGVVRLVKER